MRRLRAAYARALELDSDNRQALLGKVQLAADSGEADALDEAIEAAEAAGVPADDLRRLRAMASLMAGGGMAAVELLEPLITRSTRDTELLLAMATAYRQAEQCRSAKRYYERAQRGNSGDVRVLTGLAFCEGRLGRLAPANRLVASARRAADDARDEALVEVAAGWVDLEYGRLGPAQEHADAAIEKNSELSDAYFLRALVADARGRDSEADLRRTLEQPYPWPEAMGLLVLQESNRARRCELARRYSAADPEGIDARRVASAASGCR